MSELALVLVAVLSFIAGMRWRRLVLKIERLQRAVEAQKKAQTKQKTEPTIYKDKGTMVLNPYDAVDRIKMAHDEEIRRLNPNKDDL